MLNYKVSLINVWWSEDGEDYPLFLDNQDRNNYFNNLTLNKISKLQNFKLNDGVRTTIVYRDESGRKPLELIKCNYAVIYEYEVDSNGQETLLNMRFYFAYPSQISGNQLSVELSLDDITTNYIDARPNIAPCRIKRAMVNRFIEDSENSNLLNFRLDNCIIEEEEVPELTKFIQERIPISVYGQSSNENTQDLIYWLEDNIAFWVYVYLDPGKKFAQQEGQQELTDIKSYVKNFPFGGSNTAGFNTPYGCIAYPIYKTNNRIYHKAELPTGDIQLHEFSQQGFINLLNNNTDATSYIYGVKYSVRPPFYIDLKSDNISIEDNNLIWTPTNDNFSTCSGFNFYHKEDSSKNAYIFSNISDEMIDKKSFETSVTIANNQLIFTKEEVKGLFNPKFNPKMNSRFFKDIRLVDWGGNSFDYDLQYLNTIGITVKYTETIQPEITRYYLRLKAEGLYESSYGESLDNNYFGLTGSCDTSTPFYNLPFAEFLANNKNFYTQKAITYVSNGLKSITTLDPLQVLGTGVEMITDAVQTQLKLDNLKNAPQSLQNAQGNAYFNSQITNFSIYYEQWQVNDCDYEDWAKFMNKNGFKYNQIESISEVDSTRKYFNYIEAEVENIAGNFSNIEKQRLRDKLRKIRFWHGIEPNYTNENYEIWLDN